MAARMADQQHSGTTPAGGGAREVREVPSDRAVLAAELGDLIEVTGA